MDAFRGYLVTVDKMGKATHLLVPAKSIAHARLRGGREGSNVRVHSSDLDAAPTPDGAPRPGDGDYAMRMMTARARFNSQFTLVGLIGVVIVPLGFWLHRFAGLSALALTALAAVWLARVGLPGLRFGRLREAVRDERWDDAERELRLVRSGTRSAGNAILDDHLLFHEAKIAAGRGQRERALGLWDRIRHLEPERRMSMRGSLLLALDDRQGALEALEEAARGGDIDAWVELRFQHAVANEPMPDVPSPSYDALNETARAWSELCDALRDLDASKPSRQRVAAARAQLAYTLGPDDRAGVMSFCDAVEALVLPPGPERDRLEAYARPLLHKSVAGRALLRRLEAPAPEMSSDHAVEADARTAAETEGTPAAPVADPFFGEVRRMFIEPPASQTSALIYVGLFLFFLFGQLEGLKSLPGIGLLLLVLLIHEGGHALGMRLFGFRDVRMFFIPFLGAAVQGRPHGAAAWKEAVVSLLGPVPGVLLGVAGYVALQRYPFDALFEALRLLLLVNLFNLLPLGPLDGGRFLQRVLFSRHRVLEVGFLGLGSGLLALMALKGGLVALAFFAGLGLLGLPSRWRVLGAAAELARELPGLPAVPSELDEPQMRALYAKASRHTPSVVQPRRVAETMTSLLEATKAPPRAAATLGLLVLYVLAGLVGLVGVVFVSLDARGAEWRDVDAPSFHAELPRAPTVFHRQAETHAGPRPSTVWRAVLQGTRRFSVEVVDAGQPIHDADRWLADARQRLAAEADMRVVKESPTPTDGVPGLDLELARWGRTMHAHLAVDNDRLYVVVASAGEWGPDQERFMRSFRPGKKE